MKTMADIDFVSRLWEHRSLVLVRHNKKPNQRQRRRASFPHELAADTLASWRR